MKTFKRIISVCMMMIILLETLGFSRIHHCCGNSELLFSISEIDHFWSNDISYEHQHGVECECEHSHMTKGALGKMDYCHDHRAPGFHKHHHDASCLNADYLQLRPEQKDFNGNILLHTLLPKVITVFDFLPSVQEILSPIYSYYLTPQDVGRHLLSLFSILLI